MTPRWLAIGPVLVMVAACSSPPPPPPPAPSGPPQLRAAEIFNWTGEQISFSLPPTGWRREGETGGGIKGNRWVKEKSVGEAIGVGDYYILADRNRSPYLRELLGNFDTFEPGGTAWSKAIRQAYAYTDTPFTSAETEIATTINNAVSQASGAFRSGDRNAARTHLMTALSAAESLRFSLADVIDRVEFKPERRQEPDHYRVTGRREATIAGDPAVIVDYTVKVPERAYTYRAREVYFVHNSHLFICTFIGLPETLAVFDAVIATIQFPN